MTVLVLVKAEEPSGAEAEDEVEVASEAVDDKTDVVSGTDEAVEPREGGMCDEHKKEIS